MSTKPSKSSGSDQTSFSLELTPAQLKVTHNALMTFLHDFGHEEHDVNQLVRGVLSKFPPEETINAIDLSSELS